MTTGARIQTGGEGDPLLVLLHGMGATSDVWRGLIALLPGRWSGRWIAPDLPGHGGTAPLSRYSFGHLAAAVATEVPASARVIVMGHSLGGVVALALASGWFGVNVAAVCGLGIKVSWSDEELARAAGLAARPHPIYPTRDQAAERHLKLAGLVGLMAPAEVPDAALIEMASGWTVRFDPAAFAMGRPPMARLLATAQSKVVLAAGERDPMSPRADLAALVPNPTILAGLGHNAQVEDPEQVWALIAEATR